MPSTTDLVGDMAQALAGAGVNLDNERDCIRALLEHKYAEGDIVSCIDDARAAAKTTAVSQ